MLWSMLSLELASGAITLKQLTDSMHFFIQGTARACSEVLPEDW